METLKTILGILGTLAFIYGACAIIWIMSTNVAAKPTYKDKLSVRDKLFAALRYVETGNQENPPDGDNGKSIGPYQISYAYWRDAYNHRSSIGGKYQDCRKKDYSEKVIDAYMDRWAPHEWKIILRDQKFDAPTLLAAEVIARTHNGGPSGRKRKSTLNYWNKIKQALEIKP